MRKIVLMCALLLTWLAAAGRCELDLNPTPAPEADRASDPAPLSEGALLDSLPFDAACGALLLAEQESGQVILEMNGDVPRPVASVTKLMTILLALSGWTTAGFPRRTW